MVTSYGIVANQEKFASNINLKELKAICESQPFNDKITILSRFLYKLVERSIPFIKALRGQIWKIKTSLSRWSWNIEWNEEARRAFKEHRALLQTPPLLIWPVLGKVLFLKLDAIDEAIS